MLVIKVGQSPAQRLTPGSASYLRFTVRPVFVLLLRSRFPANRLRHSFRSAVAERMDPVSVIYSYRIFREAHRDLETRQGIEFIGYQMVKMGDVKGAIELLKANADDYPTSASAQFGLGRAYNAAGDVENARKAFSRTLQIDPSFKKATDGLNALR
jgi:D-alanyl-D-alanine carboxypeptidase